jgi:hypothetical protein
VGLRWLGAIALVVLALGGVFVGQAVTAGPGGWDHVGDGGALRPNALNANVTAMNGDAPGRLLVGGDFTDAGGDLRADHIASWNGVSWSPVGSASDQITGGVRAIAYANGKVYAGGTFTNAGGDDNADSLAVWDGATWKPFCDPVVPGHPTPGSVAALQVVGSTLYVGGAFQDWAGIGDLDYLVACDLSSGTPSRTLPQGKFLNGVVYALTADSNGVLYAGGGFSNVDDIPQADEVAAFAGGSWSALGSGPACVCGAITDFVRSLTTIGTDVYVGTDAENVAGIAQADSVARWNGSAWSAVGSSADGGDGWFPSSTSVYAMTSFAGKLYATGSFQDAGGDPTADHVAVFDGAAWHPVGSNGAGNGPWSGEGHGLVVFDRLAPATSPRSLYAGGSFTSAGGDTLANRIASFSLASITPVPTPTVTPATPVATPVPTPTPMPQATPTPTPDTIRPKITALRLAQTTFRAAPSGAPFRAARAAIGTTVTFTLSEPGTVRFTIDRSAAGRKVKARCVKPSRSNRNRPRCERQVAVKGSFTVTGRKGVNRIELRGRIGGRALAPGRYRLNARETDRAANLSITRRTAFTIVR